MSKYRAIKTDCASGHTHDSGLEASRCNDLHVLQGAGELCDLELQPEFPVEINGKPLFKYLADFAWRVKGARVVEDVKGVRTPVYRLKKRIVEAFYPGTVITEWPPRKRKARRKKAA